MDKKQQKISKKDSSEVQRVKERIVNLEEEFLKNLKTRKK